MRAATETTAIQCKYYEGTSYDHSVIAKSIRWMLNTLVDVYKRQVPSHKLLFINLSDEEESFLDYVEDVIQDLNSIDVYKRQILILGSISSVYQRLVSAAC